LVPNDSLHSVYEISYQERSPIDWTSSPYSNPFFKKLDCVLDNYKTLLK
jgi:hypothetical protein